MSKLPVLATVSRAYGFLLGEIGTIVRLTWAPLLLAAAVSYFYGDDVLDIQIATFKDASRAMESAPLELLIACVSFVTGVIALVGLLRVMIFGDRKPGLFVNLWPGAAELRLILVVILLGVAVTAAAVGALLVVLLLVALSAALPAFSVVLVLGLLALIVVAVWASVRLSLIGPVVVAERSLGVERSWALTRGNALSLFLILLLTFLPYLIAMQIITAAIMGSDFPTAPAWPTMAGSDAKAFSEAFAAAWQDYWVRILKAYRAHWPEFSVLSFFASLIATALSAGVLGSAYNTIAGEPKH